MSNKRLVYVAGISENDKIGHYIRSDISNIKCTLENYENRGQIILRIDEFVTKRSFIRRFIDQSILPWLFYYSGHSSDEYIVFSDSKISSDTFVDIFDNDRIKNSLHLVYLGSCNSKSIGEKLIEKGLKNVIVSNSKVQAHLSNIISNFFFNTLFTSKNVSEAYETSKRLFNLDRESYNISEEVVFPWEILNSNETDLFKPIKPINMSAIQKHQIAMNNTSIRLNMLNYYIKEDNSTEKKTDKIKMEVENIQNKLMSSLTFVGKNEQIKTLIKPLINIPSSDFLPNKDRLIRSSNLISNLNSPDNFIKNTVNQITELSDFSNNIINY